MLARIHKRLGERPAFYVLPNMENCFTWSFPEFMPFCVQLYYFSSLKDFSTLPRVWSRLGKSHSLNF